MFLIRLKRFPFSRRSIFQTLYRNKSSFNISKITSATSVQERIAESFNNEEKNGFVVPIFKKSLLFGNNIAIKDHCGAYTYVQLFAASQKLASQLSNIYGSASSRRVCFLCPNNVLTLVAFWACWISGQVAVPLNGLSPISMIKLAIQNADSRLLITTSDNESFLQPLAIEMELTLVVIDHKFVSQPMEETSLSNIFLCNGDSVFLIGTLTNDFYTVSDAMLAYTLEEDATPKSTILSHRNLNEQIKCFTEAMQFRDTDCVLHLFPINSIHSCVNTVFCPLCCGAKVIMLNNFSSQNVWNSILGINTPEKERANVIMGVPAIYDVLIEDYYKLFDKDSKVKKHIRSYCSENIRIMTTAISSLKQETFEKWKEITGHCLLEGTKL